METEGVSGDIYIILYDENFTDITTDDNSGIAEFSRIQTTLESGNYSIIVFEDGNDAVITYYNLTLTVFEIPVISEFTDAWIISLFSLLPIIAAIVYKKKQK